MSDRAKNGVYIHDKKDDDSARHPCSAALPRRIHKVCPLVPHRVKVVG